MASGISGADELPKERHKLSEFHKVYTRKYYRNSKNNVNNNSNSSTVTLAAANNQPDDTIVAGTKDKTPIETNHETPFIDSNNGVVVEDDKTVVEANDRADVEKNDGSDFERKGKIPSIDTNNGIAVVQDDRTAIEKSDRAVVDTNDRLHVEKNDGFDVERNGKTPPIDIPVDINSGVVVVHGDRTTEKANDRADAETNDNAYVEKNDGVDVERNNKAVVVISNVIVVENNGGERHVGEARTSNENTEETVIEGEPERISFQLRQHVEEANSSQPEQDSPRVESVTLCEDSSSFNRVVAPLPNGHLANGVVREERPLVSQVDDRLKISVSAAKSREQVRDLKRKLEDELDQVRKMARKLEAKEVQLDSVSFSMEAPLADRLPEVPLAGRFPEDPLVGGSAEAPIADWFPEAPVVGRSEEPSIIGRVRIPINGGMENNSVSMRVNQDFGSFGHNSRPFGQLSVSLMENNYGVGDVVEKEKRTPKANQFYRNSDFILGKEKLPPAETNRKSKSSGGRKHSTGDFDFSYGIDKKIFKKCGDLLEKLRKHKHAWVFNQPVDVKALRLHDYFDIIKHPMDLGTVKTRLANNWYKTPREFAEDVRLTFHNAMTYNPEGQDVHIMARDMLKSFEDKWPAIQADYERKLRYEMMRDLGTPTPTSRKTYAPAHVPIHMPPPPLLQPPPFQETSYLDRSQSMPVRREVQVKATVRTPARKKPKAKDPHKREMTFEEKQKLSINLQNLPPEKLDAIVQIIKKRNSALSQHDDEIEVDIDNVDTETLWELDRFVTNYKKSLSKHKRKAEIAAARAATAAAAQAAQPTIPAPASMETPRECTPDGGNVAPSPHVQQERQSGNENGSSSSSSSSSNSGSSSSDSDSDSSSSSDSDEER